MKAGDKVRISCEECNTETEVLFEPKGVGLPQEERDSLGEGEVSNCPMCGSESFIVES